MHLCAFYRSVLTSTLTHAAETQIRNPEFRGDRMQLHAALRPNGEVISLHFCIILFLVSYNESKKKKIKMDGKVKRGRGDSEENESNKQKNRLFKVRKAACSLGSSTDGEGSRGAAAGTFISDSEEARQPGAAWGLYSALTPFPFAVQDLKGPGG